LSGRQAFPRWCQQAISRNPLGRAHPIVETERLCLMPGATHPSAASLISGPARRPDPGNRPCSRTALPARLHIAQVQPSRKKDAEMRARRGRPSATIFGPPSVPAEKPRTRRLVAGKRPARPFAELNRSVPRQNRARRLPIAPSPSANSSSECFALAVRNQPSFTADSKRAFKQTGLSRHGGSPIWRL